MEKPGETYGYWFIVAAADRRGGQRHWLCRCRCGTERSVSGPNLLRGLSRSCGCREPRPYAFVTHAKHGQWKARIYKIWGEMKQRCGNPNNRAFSNYGGRGIQVCEAWQDFQRFWQDMGPSYVEGLSIERLDVNGNYEPGNCTWIPLSEQPKNQRPRSERAVYRNNKSGVTGVCWSKRHRKWVAQYNVPGGPHHLGYFRTIEEAAAAYQAAVERRQSSALSHSTGALTRTAA